MIVASLFEILPTFLIGGNVPTIATVKPYTPLELYGRDIYIREGCYNCHSQMVRPFLDETVRYGQNGKPAEYSRPGEFVYDHPFQWGSKRTGPGPRARRRPARRALAPAPPRESARRRRRARSCRATRTCSPTTSRGTIIQTRVDAMAMLGVPYGAQALDDARGRRARPGRSSSPSKLATAGGPAGMENKEVIALIAYLQRLGVDIRSSSKEVSK